MRFIDYLFSSLVPFCFHTDFKFTPFKTAMDESVKWFLENAEKGTVRGVKA